MTYFIIFKIMFRCMSFHGNVHMSAGAHRDIGTQAAASHPTWVLRTQRRSSGRQNMFLPTEPSLQPEFEQCLVVTHNFIQEMHAIIVYEDSKKALKEDELSKTVLEVENLYAKHYVLDTFF